MSEPTLADLLAEVRDLRSVLGRSERKALSYEDVAEIMHVSPSTVRRMAKQPSFPKARQFQTDDKGTSITRFVASEIHDWLERKASQAS